MARKLEVEIVGDASSLQRAFGQAGKSTSGFGKSMTRFGKLAALGLGAAGVGGALAVLKTGFAEASESAKVMAQTGAVLESTGGAAKVTAGQVEGLASSLSRMSGVDDEAIQAGENLLLTFTRIRNEVGKGNDVFNQATTAALNMSVALGKDMTSSSLLVGKALNDPIAGLGALSRAGVQFTEAQKETIKSMVATGDTLGAQKLILAELETQFGGSAKAAGETLPGQLAKAKLAFEEVSGQILTQMLPAIVKMLQGFSDFLVWAQANWPRVQEVVEMVFAKVRAAAAATIAYYNANIKPALQNVLAALTALWRVFGDTITNVARIAFTMVTTIVRSALTILRGIVEGALALLRGDWSQAWNSLKAILSAAWSAYMAMIKAQVQIMLAIFRGLGGLIKSALGNLGGLLVDAGRAIIQGLIDGLQSKLDAVRSLVGSIGGMIKGLKGPIQKDRVLLVDEGRAIIQGLQAGMVSQMAGLQRTVSGFSPQIAGAAGGASTGGGGGGLGNVYLDGELVGKWMRANQARYERANGAV